MREWLATDCRLMLKHPDAEPRSTRATFDWLGWRVSRAGIAAGPRVLQSAQRRARLCVRRGDAAGLERTLASYRGLVVFGGLGLSAVEVSEE